MNACEHQHAYAYVEGENGRAFIVRHCTDCHQEIVRREINEDFVREESQLQPPLIIE